MGQNAGRQTGGDGQGTRGAHVEHLDHGRNLGRIPAGYVRIEVIQVVEEVAHVGDGRDAPAGDGAVLRNGRGRVRIELHGTPRWTLYPQCGEAALDGNKMASHQSCSASTHATASRAASSARSPSETSAVLGAALPPPPLAHGTSSDFQYANVHWCQLSVFNLSGADIADSP